MPRENDHLQSETIASDPGGNNGAESYTYDAVGNRKTLSSTIPSLPGSMNYTYDANDRLTTDSYDNNGNTTSSSGISFTYDFENRLLMKGAVINVYDGDGNRVSETAAMSSDFSKRGTSEIHRIIMSLDLVVAFSIRFRRFSDSFSQSMNSSALSFAFL